MLMATLENVGYIDVPIIISLTINDFVCVE